jgi:hypothetical protein
MSYYTLPFEPYITKVMWHYKIDPTFEPLKFYEMLRDEYGAYVQGGSSVAYEKPYFFFYTEQEKLTFLLRFS